MIGQNQNAINGFMFSSRFNMTQPVEYIRNEYGNDGYGVLLDLYQMIFSTNGYYAELDNKAIEALAKKNAISANQCAKILNAIISTKLINCFSVANEEVWNNSYIFTSADIQSEFKDQILNSPMEPAVKIDKNIWQLGEEEVTFFTYISDPLYEGIEPTTYISEINLLDD